MQREALREFSDADLVDELRRRDVPMIPLIYKKSLGPVEQLAEHYGGIEKLKSAVAALEQITGLREG